VIKLVPESVCDAILGAEEIHAIFQTLWLNKKPGSSETEVCGRFPA
jgi:hypothetical protein